MKKEIVKCSKCCFGYPRIKDKPLTYMCISPYESPEKCKFGIKKLRKKVEEIDIDEFNKKKELKLLSKTIGRKKEI